MPSCLGIYIQNNLIKYAKISKERDNTKVEAYGVKFYETDIEKTLEYIVRNINRKMIMFVVTDATGIASISQNTLKKLVHQHNVLFISIDDAKITEGKAFDVEKDSYIPDYISANKELLAMEQSIRKNLDEDNEKKLLQNRIVSVCIDNDEEVVDKIIQLLGGHKYANNR